MLSTWIKTLRLSSFIRKWVQCSSSVVFWILPDAVCVLYPVWVDLIYVDWRELGARLLEKKRPSGHLQLSGAKWRFWDAPVRRHSARVEMRVEKTWLEQKWFAPQCAPEYVEIEGQGKQKGGEKRAGSTKIDNIFKKFNPSVKHKHEHGKWREWQSYPNCTAWF